MMAHTLFEALAYTVGFIVYRILRARAGDPIPEANRWTVIAAAAVGAVVGSKLLYWIEDPQLVAAHWREPEFLMGGKTIVGGLIGGLIAVELSKLFIGERRSTGDLFAVPLCVGIAVGRIGCYLAGPADHTWGRPTTSLFAVDGGDGVPRYCLPAYEIAFLLGLAAVLVRVSPRLTRSGDAFRLFMIGYMVFRLAAEALKDDVTFAGLTSIQWACMATLVYYAGDAVRLAVSMRRLEPAS
jgi:phosphatidylglycerol---prolipoprotein diacylglyceryl transferase